MDQLTSSKKQSKNAPVDRLLKGLTSSQERAVTHTGGPLLIVAGAGTGKTSVITRRIAWLIATKRAKPEEILALTFSEKAATEMEERVDILVPYGYLDITIRTFHAFGDSVLREYAHLVGLSPYFNVYSQSEQAVFLKDRLFEFPLKHLRPLNDPGRYVSALLTLFSRAKDEMVSESEFIAEAKRALQELHPGSDEAKRIEAERLLEMARTYADYRSALKSADAVDFGDQVYLAIRLLEDNPALRKSLQELYRYVLVDEFQDTNFAQYRLLELLAPKTAEATVVADDDQSIYKWRGAALSNVVKFLESYDSVETIVLTDNFRCTQPILDRAYQLIRYNNPDRLEVKQGIDKRLKARASDSQEEVHFHLFDTGEAESNWVAQQIRSWIQGSECRAKDVAILVRSNREADPFIRALNLAGVPWQFSGASGLFSRPEAKMLLSCLRVLTDSSDAMSWYHVASSEMYAVPMPDLVELMAAIRKSHRQFEALVDRMDEELPGENPYSEQGCSQLKSLVADVRRLREISRRMSAGQVLYQWLHDQGFLELLAKEENEQDAERLSVVARFFEQLRQVEKIGGSQLPEVMAHADLFEAIGQEAPAEDDVWSDRVQVLTVHKSKGLEFPRVFMVGLIQDRFPSRRRRDVLELPEALVKDILPEGDYHMQEERRLFYVGMTRAKQSLHLTAAYNYGGKTTRKVSQFVLEALDLSTPNPPARVATAKELIERSQYQAPLTAGKIQPDTKLRLRLDPHGADDYLTCPLKYRFSHVLKIPVLRHHLVGYGSAMHKVIEKYYVGQMRGEPPTLEQLLGIFDDHWSADGYLSLEHEEKRREQGRRTLTRFYERQTEFPENPDLIEAPFKFALTEGILVAGRWDRVDVTDEGAVIIDYKTSEVTDSKAADRKARSSSQLQVYALAWQELKGKIPARGELRFIETDFVGQTRFTEKTLEQTRKRLLQAAEGIRSQNFEATPNEFDCRWCAYQAICPKSALRK